MARKAIVTGSAGFIGSHLCEALIKNGYDVIGIDSFTDYYDRKIKESNLSLLNQNNKFNFIKEDLIKLNLNEYMNDTDFIFHQAGQPGVRGSWGEEFDIYVINNIIATQRLLEAAKNFNIKKFVYASSSSIYGNADVLPMAENHLPRPFSPYGVTKLSAEQLCDLYNKNYGLPAVSLRYFTVYGPRQRPEMAISTFIKSIIKGEEINIYGDGTQIRDFTYIDDVINANILAAHSNIKGEIFNVASGKPIKLIDIIYILETIIGKKAVLNFVENQKGDVKGTYGDINKIKSVLGYSPSFDIKRGLYNQVNYMKNIYLNSNNYMED